MKAMVLAAGLGTRLRPFTNDRPKALVEVAGRTMLALTLARLRAFGIHEVIVNVFHFADQIVEYLYKNENFGMHIAISREETLLDTGGGLLKAAWFFLDSAGAGPESGAGTDAEESDAPFLVHNVDILSDFNLQQMLQTHRQRDALATLAVQQRPTSRPLLFSPEGQLLGRASATGQAQEGCALAFAGVHILSPRIFERIRHEPTDAHGAFSIISAYTRLAQAGERILAFQDDAAYWRDLGKPESIAESTRDIQQRPELAP